MPDRGRSHLRLFGWLTIAFWLSRAVIPFPIPPLVRSPDFHRIVGEVRPWTWSMVFGERSHGDVVDSLRVAALVNVAIAWALIAAGVTAGLLLLARRRLGRWLAWSLSLWMLAWAVIDRARTIAEHGLGKAIEAWSLLAQNFPLWTADQVLKLAFSAVTLWYLGRRSMAPAFAHAHSE